MFDSKPKIIHRDISNNNILLGKEDAPDGERGILIDLDLAVRILEGTPALKPDYRIVRLPCLRLAPYTSPNTSQL